MAYNRTEPPYSSGTHLKGPGLDTKTPARGTLCNLQVPRAGVRQEVLLDEPGRPATEKYPHKWTPGK